MKYGWATAMMIVFLLVGCHSALHGQVQPTEEAQPNAIAPPAADWSIPTRYQGKIVRTRVRYFPEKLLALTFDDGPSEDITPRILETLATYNAHATFFVMGRRAKLHPDLLKRIVADGNVIGNHSYSHPKQVTAAEAAEEIAKTQKLIETATGHTPKLFRPPYGIIKGNLAQTALKDGYTVIAWTISTADSRLIGPDVIASNVIHTPNPGDIVIMHDGIGHTATAEALPLILKQLGDSGYKFVTIPELLRAWDKYLESQPTPHSALNRP